MFRTIIKNTPEIKKTQFIVKREANGPKMNKKVLNLTHNK